MFFDNYLQGDVTGINCIHLTRQTFQSVIHVKYFNIGISQILTQLESKPNFRREKHTDTHTWFKKYSNSKSLSQRIWVGYHNFK